MDELKRISIIIIVHNNIPMSQCCLEALSKAVAHLDHEVIVMDNASTESIDGVRESSHLFHRFRVYRSEENLPFSRINNRGAEKATGDLLLFMNNDVFVEPQCVECLARCFSMDRDAGITGGILLFPGKTAVQHAGMRQMLWGYASNYGVGARLSDARIQERCERFALTGAMMCLPRDVFRKVHGFAEGYIWGYEDVDLCLKIKSSGLRVVYEPEAVGVHVQSATLNVLKNGDLVHNYRLYRKTWDSLLVPLEQSYLSSLEEQAIHRVVVFGTGVAARGLAAILIDRGIEVVAFTSSRAQDSGEKFMGRPVLSLGSLSQLRFDRLIVGSQFFFEVEPEIRGYDPLHEPIYPILQ